MPHVSQDDFRALQILKGFNQRSVGEPLLAAAVAIRTVLGDDVDAAAKLTRIHHKLLEKATLEPVSAKKLIKLAGYKYNTYARDAITDLCRHGLLVRLPDGLRRPASSQASE